MVASAPKFHIVETKEPAFSVSPRNPAGDILTVRTPLVVSQKDDGTLDAAQTVKDTIELFKLMVDAIVGVEWEESTRVYMASFDPAVAQAMADGVGVEDALDIKDPTANQANAYKRLSKPNVAGATRSGSGSGGSGGGTPDNLIDLDKLAQADYDALPKGFTDELRNGTTCPECRDSTKFWDNRGSDKGGPKFSCANKDCQGGGKKQSGGRFPWGWFGEKQSDSGGGGRRRSRGD